MSTEHLMGDISSVLEAFLGMADEPRREAELHLQKLTLEQPAEVLLLLAQIGAQGVGGFQLDHRLLTLILLKRTAFQPLPGLYLNAQHQHPTPPFDVLRTSTLNRIETVICTGLKDEMDTRMRKGLGACAANWAQECHIRHRPVLPLPPVLLELTSSPHPFHRYTTFQLLDLVPSLFIDAEGALPGESRGGISVPVEQLEKILLAGMGDPSVDVRIEAIKAVRSAMIEGLGQSRSLKETIGANLILQAFETLRQIPQNLAVHALIPLVDISGVYPDVFVNPSAGSNTLNTVLSTLLPLLSPPSQGTTLPSYRFSSYPSPNMTLESWEEIANPATEIIITLMELRPKQMSQAYEGRLVKEVVGLLLDRQSVTFDLDVQEWLEIEDLDEEDDDYPVFTEESLDRLAMALGGELVIPALSELCQNLLRQEDWRCRFSAIIGISCTADGCLDELQPRLRDVLTLLSPTAKDPHPRVRYAFVQCLGQMCTDCEGAIQEKFSEDVLQVLSTLLDDSVMRVRVHSAAALTNFFQEVGPTSYTPAQLDLVVQGLMRLYQSGSLYAQEQVLATIATVANSAEAGFMPYYRSVMDSTIQMLSIPILNDKEQRKVQGRAMECATMIGLAAGKATFSTDAVKVAQLMIVIQNHITDSDDPRSAYLMESWSTMCQVLKEDFEPFLAHVVPPLLKAASYKPPKTTTSSIALSAADDTDVDYAEATSGAHTAELEEKAGAFENLTVYAFHMRGKFAPFLDSCMQLTLEELSFPHDEGVREAASYLVPGLLQVAKDSNAWADSPQNLIRVFEQLINHLVKSPDAGSSALLYKSFTDSLHVISTAFPPHLTAQLLKCTHAILRDIAQARSDRAAQEEYMDYHAEREIFLEEQHEEDACLGCMKKAVEMILRMGSSKQGKGIEALGNGLKEELMKALQMIAEVKKTGMKDDSNEDEFEE